MDHGSAPVARAADADLQRSGDEAGDERQPSGQRDEAERGNRPRQNPVARLDRRGRRRRPRRRRIARTQPGHRGMRGPPGPSVGCGPLGSVPGRSSPGPDRRSGARHPRSRAQPPHRVGPDHPHRPRPAASRARVAARAGRSNSRPQYAQRAMSDRRDGCTRGRRGAAGAAVGQICQSLPTRSRHTGHTRSSDLGQQALLSQIARRPRPATRADGRSGRGPRRRRTEAAKKMISAAAKYGDRARCATACRGTPSAAPSQSSTT
jgi:hypothetical protein